MSQPLHVSLGSEHGDFIGISHLPAGAAAFPGTVKLARVSDCARDSDWIRTQNEEVKTI